MQSEFRKEDFQRAKLSYYRLMGCDDNGFPGEDKLVELGITV